MHVDFDWPRQKHTEFMLKCSIFNFLTVFCIKFINSPITPKRKVDISSNFNRIVYRLELFTFMENTQMWNTCQRENEQQNQKQILWKNWKLNILARIQCVFVLTSRNIHACSCMTAKKYPVTEMFPYNIS
jgi:hypothetical protein